VAVTPMWTVIDCSQNKQASTHIRVLAFVLPT
jgi:hypothetical protein